MAGFVSELTCLPCPEVTNKHKQQNFKTQYRLCRLKWGSRENSSELWLDLHQSLVWQWRTRCRAFGGATLTRIGIGACGLTEMVWRRLEQVSRWPSEGWIVVVVALDNKIGSCRCDGDATGDGGWWRHWLLVDLNCDLMGWETQQWFFFFFLVLRWGFKQIGVCSDTKTEAGNQNKTETKLTQGN